MSINKSDVPAERGSPTLPVPTWSELCAAVKAAETAWAKRQLNGEDTRLDEAQNAAVRALCLASRGARETEEDLLAAADRVLAFAWDAFVAGLAVHAWAVRPLVDDHRARLRAAGRMRARCDLGAQVEPACKRPHEHEATRCRMSRSEFESFLGPALSRNLCAEPDCPNVRAQASCYCEEHGAVRAATPPLCDLPRCTLNVVQGSTRCALHSDAPPLRTDGESEPMQCGSTECRADLVNSALDAAERFRASERERSAAASAGLDYPEPRLRFAGHPNGGERTAST